MIAMAIDVAFGLLAVAILLTLFRVVRAPNLCDRLLALDTLFINMIGVIVLWGMTETTSIYFEVALITAALGFVSTVAYARFLLRGDIIE